MRCNENEISLPKHVYQCQMTSYRRASSFNEPTALTAVWQKNVYRVASSRWFCNFSVY